MRFEGAPAEDTIRLTVMAWASALCEKPHTWIEDRDAERLTIGFKRVAGSAKRWPLPAHLWELLPPQQPQLKLDSPKGKYTPETKRLVADLMARLNAKPKVGA